MAHTPEELLYRDLSRLIQKKVPEVNLSRIERAYRFAEMAHAGQFRASGVSYVCHPLEVATILANLHADEDTLVAALLHDVPEDTAYTLEDLEHRFGKTVSRLVSALTKLSKVHYQHSMDDRQVDALRRMFLETANDVRVVFIKLADRLHNMRTLRYLRPDKQQRIAKETLEIFAPLANVYGIFQIRRELEDLCFQVLQPEEYARIEAFVSDQQKSREAFIDTTVGILKRQLRKHGLHASLDGRPKHFYSTYQKMLRHHKNLADIYDYFAIRILVETEEECYRALGIVHSVFKPKPGRFKDYIAFAKPNGYRSLHTTVVGLEGKLTEVQIRTQAMHDEAEFGAASHLLYKSWKGIQLTENLARLKHDKHPEGFIRSLQEDFLQRRIFVFTPDGTIVNLPLGATCLDFVYAVDLPVDQKAINVFVNNKPYSLFGELQRGDHVEIIFGDKAQNGPQRNWLEHVKTSKAKEKIRAHFQEQSLGTKLGLGTALLQKKLDQENQGLVHNIPSHLRTQLIKKFHFNTFDDALAAIGEGELSPLDVYKTLFPELTVSTWTRWTQRWRMLLKRFNFGEADDKYRIRILVDAYDRVGLLKDLIRPFYDLKIPIVYIKATGYDVVRNTAFLSDGSPAHPDYISKNTIDVLVEDHEQLIALFDRLEKVSGIVRVQRAFRQNTGSFVVLSLATALYFLGYPLLLEEFIHLDPDGSVFWTHAVVYLGLFSLLGLLFWLRSMGNKTFPHFEETRSYWALSFSLSFLAMAVVFVENAAFQLHLNMPLTAGFSVLILGFLLVSYRRHLKRRAHHLSRLGSAQHRADTHE